MSREGRTSIAIGTGYTCDTSDNGTDDQTVSVDYKVSLVE